MARAGFSAAPAFLSATGFGEKHPMKIDWKKVLYKQIGPDRRRKVPLPPPDSFNRMAQYTFTAAGFLIAATALPGIFLVIAGENVWTMLFQFMAPFLCTAILLHVCLPADNEQSHLFLSAWKERLPHRFRFAALLAVLPILKHFFLTPLSIRIGREKHDPNFAFLTALASICALAAWGIWLTQGFLSGNAGLILMGVSVALTIFSLKRLQGFSFSRKTCLFALVAALCWAGFGGWLWIEFTAASKVLDSERAGCRKLGIPFSQEKILHLMNGGEAPNAEFTKLADRLYEEKESLNRWTTDVVSDLLDSPEQRAKRRAFLHSKEAQELFSAIDRLAASGQPLRYAGKPKGILMLEYGINPFSALRIMTRLYQLRILNAAEQGDRNETMRLLRLFHRIREAAEPNGDVLGTLTGFSCEQIRFETIARLIGLNVLTDGDLAEILSMLRGLEQKFRLSAANAIRLETAFQTNTWETFGYNWLDIWFTNDPEESRQQKKYFRAFTGKTSMNHLFLAGLQLSKRQRLGEYLRKQRRNLEYLSSPKELFRRRAEFETLKREYEPSRPFFPFMELFSDWPKFVCQMEFTVTGLHMCNTALEMELRHRRTKQLHALPPDAPKDSLNGTPFELHSGSIRVWRREGKRELFREFSGWQLHSPGKRPFFPEGKYRKTAEAYFNVITDHQLPHRSGRPKKGTAERKSNSLLLEKQSQSR